MPSKNKSRNKTSKKNIIRNIFLITVSLLLFVILFIYSIKLGLFGHIPTNKELKKIKNYTASEVYSTDNYLLGRYYLQNRTNTNLKEIPVFLIKALVATEDARFYSHSGVDTRSSFRVLFKSLLLFNKSSGGGSTISQQLAKNLYPRKNLSFLTLPVAKVKEIIIAKRIEEVYSKDEILRLYLNTVPFGENTYGVETAALIYFNKDTKDLLPEESAMLIGLLKGSSLYNPEKNHDAALKRRNVVIGQMERNGYLTKDQSQKLQKRPLKLNTRKLSHDEGPAPYFREHLRNELKNWADTTLKPDGSKYNIYTDGLKIYTTIDYRLQTYAENAVKDQMTKLQKEFDKHWKGMEPWKKNPMLAQREIFNSIRYKNLIAQGFSKEEALQQMKISVESKVFTNAGEKNIKISPLDSILYHFAMLQAGLISMEAKSGFVKAWVGGINYKYFKYDHVTAHRQAGSTIKPIVFALALENGLSPCDYYSNDSTVYSDYDNWVPRNSNRSYGGYYSIAGALTHSINTVSVKVMMATGIDKTVEFAHKLGFEGNLPEVPSLALGTGTVSPFELIKAYSIFLNQGNQVTPVFIRRIEDQEGNVLYTSGPEISTEKFISEETAEKITAILCNAVNRGTGGYLRTVYGFQNEIAGKTGTTQNHCDGWFVGLTPDLITAIWVGGDNPIIRFRSIAYGQGAYMALPIYAKYLKALYLDPVFKDSQNSTFHISDQTVSSLDCEDFREKEYNTIKEYLEKREESISNFIRRIFGKKKTLSEPSEEIENPD
jgi:penicillin-binding protein 1A